MSRVSVFTLIERSIKNMGAVNPQVKDLAIELVKRSYHIGINIQITSGLRTYAEQTKLYNQGRTTKGNIVTNAKAGQSIHNFGLAIDYVLISEDGNKAFWDTNRNINGNNSKDWFEVAAIGKELGFAWGGDWQSFKDYPHLDMQRGYSLASLRAGKRPSIPNVPNRGYHGIGDINKEIGKIQADLIKVGYKIEKDDIYGQGLEDAIKAFQRASNLSVDGIWGEASQMKVNAIIANLNKPVVKPPVINPPVIKPAAPKTEQAAVKPASKPKEEKPMEKTNVPSEWAKVAVEKAVELKYTDGEDLKANMTREEGITIIMRALGLAPKLQ